MNDPRQHGDTRDSATDDQFRDQSASDVADAGDAHESSASADHSSETSQDSASSATTPAEVPSDVEFKEEPAAEPSKRLKRGGAGAGSGGSGLLSGGVATSRALVVTPKQRKGKLVEEETPAFDPASDLPMYREGMDWFVLRVASNKEGYVRDTLLRKVQIEGMESLVGRIMVPTEKTTTLKGKKAKVTETKLYPGYVFVEMKLEPDGRIPQDVFFLIKETTGVGDFVGTAGRPTPMAPHEVEKMLFDSRRPDDAPTVRMDFAKGDSVTINEGPFQSFQGTVDEVLPERGLVRVLVTIFGRQAPVELEYWQIVRADE